jgi:hypothetical protein
MGAEHTPLSPQERLASSRRAITRQLLRRNGRDDGLNPNAAGSTDGVRATGGGWWDILRSASLAWWQHHPAHTAAEVAAPVVKAYARERPIQILGIAAGAGAAVMLLRPWRRAWFNRALSGALGSTDFSGIALSLLSRHPNHHDKRNHDD